MAMLLVQKMSRPKVETTMAVKSGYPRPQVDRQTGGLPVAEDMPCPVSPDALNRNDCPCSPIAVSDSTGTSGETSRQLPSVHVIQTGSNLDEKGSLGRLK